MEQTNGSNICHIIAPMAFLQHEFTPQPGEMVIAVDSGYHRLLEMGIMPDLLIGDLDSLDAPLPETEVLRLPCEKNDTDMQFAVNYALEHGYKTLFIRGGIGGRLDHTIANLQTLSFTAENGGRAFLCGEGYTATVIENGSLIFSADDLPSGYVSVFCQGEPATGVNLTGLKYPLENATLTTSYPIGVSNEFTDQAASISVERGKLLVIWEGERVPFSIYLK